MLILSYNRDKIQVEHKIAIRVSFYLPSFPQLISVTVCRVHTAIETTIETDMKTGSEINHRENIAEILLDKKRSYLTESGSNLS